MTNTNTGKKEREIDRRASRDESGAWWKEGARRRKKGAKVVAWSLLAHAEALVRGGGRPGWLEGRPF